MADISYIRKGGPWKQFCNKILNHEGSKKLLESGIRMKIGNGEGALFWHDSWLNNSVLKNQFPRLFLIARLPLATVAAMARINSSGCQWIIPWIRPLRVRDLEEWDLLHQLLLQVSFQAEKEDSMIWEPSRSGSYSVKSFYMEISKNLGSNSSSCIQQIIPKLWKNQVPYRIEVFFWLALQGKINTKKKLVLLKIIPMEETLAPSAKHGQRTLLTSSFTVLLLRKYGAGGGICGIFLGYGQQALTKHLINGLFLPRTSFFGKFGPQFFL